MAREPTLAELALVGLHAGDQLPAGGPILPAIYFEGSQSSENAFVRQLAGILSCDFASGSFNLRLSAPVALESPQRFSVAGDTWEVVPVVLNQVALGVHAWRESRHDDTFLEVMSPVRLVGTLGVKSGDRVLVRMLSGAWLHGAA